MDDPKIDKRHFRRIEEFWDWTLKEAIRITGDKDQAETLRWQALWKLLTRITGNRNKAERLDWEAISNLLSSGRPESTRAYVGRILRNCWNTLRSDENRDRACLVMFARTLRHGVLFGNIVERLASRELVVLAAKIVAGLPEMQKQAFVLHYIAGLPHTEIADILGISAVNSRQLSYRGLRTIREIISLVPALSPPATKASP